MKRLTMLVAALVLVMGMAVNASAAPEVAISGNILMNAVWKDNWNFNSNVGQSAFEIYERADLYFTITANENLKGVLGFRSIRGEWGQNPASLGQPGSGAWTIGIRDAFLEFAWPGTDINVKAGVYNIALPQQVGGSSYVLGSRAGAVMASTAFSENVALTLGWARLSDGDANATTSADDDLSNFDAWVAILPVTLEGMSFSPYLLYAVNGENADTSRLGGAANGIGVPASESGTHYWVGSDFVLNMLDPFILKADLLFNKASSDDDTLKASGWLFDFGVDYTGFDFATLETYFVYTTGEDSDGSESERVISLANDFALGSMFWGGGLVTGDDMDNNPGGFWLLGASLTSIQSFAEGLTHDAHLFYMGGTNDEDTPAGFLTYGSDLRKGDSLIEVDFNTMYQIYDELTLYTGLSYASMDVDEDNWAAGQDGGEAWKVSTGVVYLF